MYDSSNWHTAPRARSLRRCTMLALLVLSVGCGRDGVTAPEPRTLQPRPDFSLGIVQSLGLELLPGPVPTYYSPGHQERAEMLQSWLRGADEFFKKRLKIAPPFHVAVLTPEDWAAISPIPYGVPFVTDNYRLVVLPAIPDLAAVTQIYTAARSSLPSDAGAELDALGVSYEDAVRQTLDLIGFHEVGHVYIAELGYRQDNTARWLEELLATYAAYSYLDVAQPASITVWDALSEAVLSFVEPSSRSLDDFTTEGVRNLSPAEYGWFQSHFNLRDAVIVRQRPHGTWFKQLSAHGLDQDTRAIPTSELLRRLRGFHPSFTEWADDAGLEYR